MGLFRFFIVKAEKVFERFYQAQGFFVSDGEMDSKVVIPIQRKNDAVLPVSKANT